MPITWRNPLPYEDEMFLSLHLRWYNETDIQSEICRKKVTTIYFARFKHNNKYVKITNVYLMSRPDWRIDLYNVCCISKP